MSSFLSQFWTNLGTPFVLAASAVSAAVVAFLFSRRVVPALLAAVGLLVVVAFLWYLPSRFEPAALISPEVPSLFYEYYWQFMLLEMLAVVVGGWWLWRLRRGARGGSAAMAATTGASPALEVAWGEIVGRLGWARDRSDRPAVCLIVAPGAGWAEALVEASGVEILASAPDAPGPIRAWATPEGVLLDATGVSCFGTGSVAALADLEALGRWIQAERPEFPIVRAVAVLLPAGWLDRDPVVVGRAAAALRDDFGALGRSLKVHCPVIAVVPGLEALEGFDAYRERIAAKYDVRQRCGFSFPAAEPYARERVARGIRFMTQGVYERVLEAMADRVTDEAGNARLFAFYRAVRGLGPGLEAALSSALTTARGGDPVRIQGCYLAGTGRNRARPAFADRLVRSTKGGLFSDLLAPLWSDQARADDRTYYRLAVGVGVVGATLALLVWRYLLGQAGLSPWWTAVPVGLAVLWVAVLFTLWLRARALPGRGARDALT